MLGALKVATEGCKIVMEPPAVLAETVIPIDNSTVIAVTADAL